MKFTEDTVLLTELQSFKTTNKSTLDPQIHNLVDKLQFRIESVNKQVEHILSTNQSQFALAYRNHLTKIKKQLAQITKKSEEQQKMFSSNDRILFLEKELTVFREQALKIYKKLEDTTEQAQSYKRKYEDILTAYHQCQNLCKASLKQVKQSQAIKLGLQITIKELHQKLQSKQAEILNLQTKNVKKKLANNQRYQSISMVPEGPDRSQHQCKIKFKNNYLVNQISHDQYRQYFCQCITKIRKQILQRKLVSKVDFRAVNDLKEFRDQDKVNLIVEFFSHPHLESTMLQMLFQSRTLQKIYNQSNKAILSVTANKKQFKISNKIVKTTELGCELPKMPVNTKSVFQKHRHRHNLSMA